MKMKHIIIISILLLALTACSQSSKQVSDENTVSTSIEMISEEQTEEITSVTEEEKPEPKIKPEVSYIRNICKLATIQCCYNNVAKGTKEPGSGLAHIGEKERTFWIEYSGTAEIGIEMSDVKMEVDDTNITITIPQAKILSIQVLPESYTEDSYVISEDSLNSNKITGENQREAIDKAQKDMEESVLNNKSLLINAQDRAKKLIENYIEQIGEITDVKYTITWEYE